jgi:hypothetical protein
MALAQDFQSILDSLPDDWTDLEVDLRIDDESRYIDAAVQLSFINAQPYSAEWHWRLMVAPQASKATAPEPSRACSRRWMPGIHRHPPPPESDRAGSRSSDVKLAFAKSSANAAPNRSAVAGHNRRQRPDAVSRVVEKGRSAMNPSGAIVS